MSAHPSLDVFKKVVLAQPGKLVPVYRRFLSDSLTPVEAFRRLSQTPYAFLLESVERGERIGRWSFVGADPELVISGDIVPTPKYTLEREGAEREAKSGDPIAALEGYLKERPAAQLDGGDELPPFSGGAVGYLGYDTVRGFETRLTKGQPAKRGFDKVPDVCVGLYKTVIAFDHVKNLIWIVHHADAREGGADAAHARALNELSKVARRLTVPSTEPLSELIVAQATAPAPTSNFAQPAQFTQAVEAAKEFIAAGDIIQVVLSQRFTRVTNAPPFEVYRSLRAVNPSPYMFFLRMPDVNLVGSSPEVMVRLDGRQITVRPIAGTRKRGETPEEDARLAKELLADEKERAEHIMLLDLGRNDVGRVSKLGSVRVTEQMMIENYSHVMHIVSNVTGTLEDGLGAFDVFRACHPAGTVSGAPKIRAMEIIDQLEPDARGPYAGAVGVIGWNGALNTCIAIRTIVMQPRVDGKFDAHVQAGAGLVADSVPQKEFEETQNKARAMLRALDAAEARAGK